jgi:NAD+ synthase (glutamine-hydrolysing)
VKLALAQINPTVGDLEGNVELCLAAISEARGGGADLVVLPEMVVPGNPPRDILNDSGFVDAVLEATADLACRAGGGPPVLVGSLARAEGARADHPGLLDAALLLHRGAVQLVAARRHLRSDDVHFEPRWFVPGPEMPPIEIAGRRIGIAIGRDGWLGESEPFSADLRVILAAEPYQRGVSEERIRRAAHPGPPLASVNLCGGNDELIYDGGSFALDGDGCLLARLAHCAEEIRVVDFGAPAPGAPTRMHPEEEIFKALVLGIRDFARKNGVGHVFLGLSGGIDSAVVAVLAAEALGSDHVTAVAVPSRHTDPRSTSSAWELAASLGIGFEVRELEPLHAAADSSLGDLLAMGTGAENIQARLRAAVLMAFVNARGGMLLNTSNKTELSLGYATLYGDSTGALSPLGDLTKPEVVSLAKWIRETRGVIPDFTLERPPSAELAPGQVDPFHYAEVAPRMEALVRADRGDAALRRSEHKRRAMGVILKVSPRAFGSGRLVPITRR